MEAGCPRAGSSIVRQAPPVDASTRALPRWGNLPAVLRKDERMDELDPMRMWPVAPVGGRPGLVDLQDELLTASTDLERLQVLLADAVDQLMARFSGANTQLERLRRDLPPLAAMGALDDELGGAVVALQFQDLATQLLSHANQRMRSVADALGNEALGDADAAPVEMVTRACPVAQRQMDAGSIELF